MLYSIHVLAEMWKLKNQTVKFKLLYKTKRLIVNVMRITDCVSGSLQCALIHVPAAN